MTEPFDLDQVLPWGREAAEYRDFFDLGVLDPKARILDCGGGPSSFNAEMTEAGHAVVSVARSTATGQRRSPAGWSKPAPP